VTLSRDARPSAQPGRAERLSTVLARDGATCTWCGRAFSGQVAPTTDHLVPKVKGGPSWLENEVAACRRCNGERGHQGAVDWLEECERRGWSPDHERVRRALESLQAAVAARGGQRRARPHLLAQLRRLRRRDG
jgi:hypothetical protein